MKCYSLRVLICFAFLLNVGFAAPVPCEAAAKSRISSLARKKVAVEVAKLTSVKINWQERERAEKQLRAMSAEAVLLALVPHVTKELSPLALYDSQKSAKDFADEPVQWQIDRAVVRVWRYHNKRRFVSVGRALVAALSRTKSPDLVLRHFGEWQGCVNQWIEAARIPVLTLFRQSREAEIRLAATQCLLHNTGQRHASEILRAAAKVSSKTSDELEYQSELLKSLLQWTRPTKNQTAQTQKPNAALLRLGFATLAKMEDGERGTGYSLACALGDYLKVDFRPDQNDVFYWDESELRPVFYSDTSLNALEWWKKNQSRFSVLSR